jgi:ribosomal protein S18 acetylase RimI-like enzyme
MAAVSDRQTGSLVELHDLTPAQISPLLEEEIAEWRRDLDWDFAPSAELVRRFVDMRALAGFALVDDEGVIGYSYYVLEDSKGLIGDLYVRPPYRTIQRENLLLATVLDSLWRTPGTARIEAQLLMLGSAKPAAGARPVPSPQWFASYARLFLEASRAATANLQPRHVPGVIIQPWSETRQGEAAFSIASAYEGHVDSRINDQYQSIAGARRFLTNIIQYPGCGSFFVPASFAAEDRRTGKLCGLCLASKVADDVGHITQVCVNPEHRGSGLGYELLRTSLQALAAKGCRSVSLTVTAANESAIRLYERMGFSIRRTFSAFVWDKR